MSTEMVAVHPCTPAYIPLIQQVLTIFSESELNDTLLQGALSFFVTARCSAAEVVELKSTNMNLSFLNADTNLAAIFYNNEDSISTYNSRYQVRFFNRFNADAVPVPIHHRRFENHADRISLELRRPELVRERYNRQLLNDETLDMLILAPMANGDIAATCCLIGEETDHCADNRVSVATFFSVLKVEQPETMAQTLSEFSNAIPAALLDRAATILCQRNDAQCLRHFLNYLADSTTTLKLFIKKLLSCVNPGSPTELYLNHRPHFIDMLIVMAREQLLQCFLEDRIVFQGWIPAYSAEFFTVLNAAFSDQLSPPIYDEAFATHATMENPCFDSVEAMSPWVFNPFTRHPSKFLISRCILNFSNLLPLSVIRLPIIRQDEKFNPAILPVVASKPAYFYESLRDILPNLNLTEALLRYLLEADNLSLLTLLYKKRSDFPRIRSVSRKSELIKTAFLSQAQRCLTYLVTHDLLPNEVLKLMIELYQETLVVHPREYTFTREIMVVLLTTTWIDALIYPPLQPSLSRITPNLPPRTKLSILWQSQEKSPLLIAGAVLTKARVMHLCLNGAWLGNIDPGFNPKASVIRLLTANSLFDAAIAISLVLTSDTVVYSAESLEQTDHLAKAELRSYLLYQALRVSHTLSRAVNRIPDAKNIAKLIMQRYLRQLSFEHANLLDTAEYRADKLFEHFKRVLGPVACKTVVYTDIWARFMYYGLIYAIEQGMRAYQADSPGKGGRDACQRLATTLKTVAQLPNTYIDNIQKLRKALNAHVFVQRIAQPHIQSVRFRPTSLTVKIIHAICDLFGLAKPDTRGLSSADYEKAYRHYANRELQVFLQVQPWLYACIEHSGCAVINACMQALREHAVIGPQLARSAQDHPSVNVTQSPTSEDETHRPKSVTIDDSNAGKETDDDDDEDWDSDSAHAPAYSLWQRRRTERPRAQQVDLDEGESDSEEDIDTLTLM